MRPSCFSSARPLTIVDRYNAILDQWLQRENTLSDYEQMTLNELRSLLNLNAPGWNEQELALSRR